jgi:hypothetical protein
MVSSSPLKRSALGSISSILNVSHRTPTKQGRVGKIVTPGYKGIKRKLINLFNANKENSPYKTLPGKVAVEFGGKVCSTIDLF